MVDESKCPWVWWDRDESEYGLLGFHTAEDRDRFSAGKPGPFRRRCAPGDSYTQPQMMIFNARK